MAVIVHGGGGSRDSEKVTIDGQKVTEKMNLIKGVFNNIVSQLPYPTNKAIYGLFKYEIHQIKDDGAEVYHYKFNGTSWELVVPFSKNLTWNNCIFEYNDQLLVTIGKHLYRFDGFSWIRESIFPASFAFILKRSDGLYGLEPKNDYIQLYKFSGSSWSKVNYLQYDLDYGAAVVFNDEIHILGGDDNEKTQHYKYDGISWSKVSTLPYSLKRGYAVINNNKIHILGGTDNARKHYKFNGGVWVRDNDLPYDFILGTALSINHNIHLLGGVTENKTKHYEIEVKYKEV